MLRAAAFIELCLPSPAKKPPAGSNWIHEIKHDGYRLMARRDPAGVRLFTSPGQVLPDRWRGRRLRRKWARHIRPARRHNDIDLPPDELGRDLGEALVASFPPAILDRNIATVGPP